MICNASENGSKNFRLILASGSPRRRELLTQMGYSFEIQVPDVDDNVAGHARDVVAILSRRKAEAVAPRHASALILAAYTTVCGEDGRILGKPGTPENARRMLAELSGKWHDVFTGMTLINTSTGERMTQAVRTRVHFVELTSEEIDAYVATKSPLDKAGAYGIQDMGGMFVDRIEGSYSNVVGLPMAQLRDMLARIAPAAR